MNHQPELLGEDGRVPGGFIVLVGQVQRRAQGVHLVLALPHPRRVEAAVVVFAVARLGPAVKSVGVGVQVDVKGVLLQHAAKDVPQAAVLLGVLHIGPQLGGAVPQPHGGDVPGDDEIAAVLQLGHGGFDGV